MFTSIDVIKKQFLPGQNENEINVDNELVIIINERLAYPREKMSRLPASYRSYRSTGGRLIASRNMNS